MPITILVADDSVTMQRIFEMTFAGTGAKVVTVGSGEAALAKIPEVRPDVVIADVSMSMDGYELTRAIRALGAHANIPCVLMASQHHPYDAARGAEVGVDAHVLKPFETQGVIDRVLGLAQSGRLSQTSAPHKPPTAAQPAQTQSSASQPLPLPHAPLAYTAPPAPLPPPRAPHMPPPSPPARPAAQVTESSARISKPMLQMAEDESTRPPVPQTSRHPAVTSNSQAQYQSSSARLSELETKLGGLGLTPDQTAGVLALSREVIERVVWEVVPDLAEALIKEELRRLTREA